MSNNLLTSITKCMEQNKKLMMELSEITNKTNNLIVLCIENIYNINKELNKELILTSNSGKIFPCKPEFSNIKPV